MFPTNAKSEGGREILNNTQYFTWDQLVYQCNVKCHRLLCPTQLPQRVGDGGKALPDLLFLRSQDNIK